MIPHIDEGNRRQQMRIRQSNVELGTYSTQSHQLGVSRWKQPGWSPQSIHSVLSTFSPLYLIGWFFSSDSHVNFCFFRPDKTGWGSTPSFSILRGSLCEFGMCVCTCVFVCATCSCVQTCPQVCVCSHIHECRCVHVLVCVYFTSASVFGGIHQ